MKQFLFMLLLCACFFSCKKKHTLKVTAVNKITGVPVADANIYIIEETNKVESLGGGTITHDFYNGYTDNEGLLYITKRFDRRYNYKVWCQTFDKTGTKLLYSYYMNGDGKDPAFKNGITFEVIPQAYLKLSIHNVNCQGAGDTMVLYQGNQIGSFNFNEPWYHYGCIGWESTNGYSKIPMGYLYYKWEVTRSGTTNTYYDTIYLAEGEYKTYTINY